MCDHRNVPSQGGHEETINVKTSFKAETITFPSRGPKVHKTRLDIMTWSEGWYDWNLDVWSSKNNCSYMPRKWDFPTI